MNSRLYTIREDGIVDFVVSSHVNTIRKRILDTTRDVLAIVMIGGYSRGEGSVEISGDKIIPMGDYDFMVVNRSPHFNLSGVNLSDLARAFNVGHIDVSNYWVGLLPYVPRKIFWYELKFGSRVIFGDSKILDAIPIQGPEDIDLCEGISLMFNRLDGLLRHFDPHFLSRLPPLQKKRTLVFEAAKGILACGDSLLVLRRKYNYSYRKRLDILRSMIPTDFQELLDANPNFMNDFEQVTDFKLKPDFGKVENPMKLWTTARQYLLNTIVYYWKEWIGFNGTDSARFAEALLTRSRFSVRDYFVYNFLSRANPRPVKTLFQFDRSFSGIIRASLFLLAASIVDDKIESNLVDRATEIISTIAVLEKESVSNKTIRDKWMSVRDIVDRAWTASSR